MEQVIAILQVKYNELEGKRIQSESDKKHGLGEFEDPVFYNKRLHQEITKAIKILKGNTTMKVLKPSSCNCNSIPDARISDSGVLKCRTCNKSIR